MCCWHITIKYNDESVEFSSTPEAFWEPRTSRRWFQLSSLKRRYETGTQHWIIHMDQWARSDLDYEWNSRKYLKYLIINGQRWCKTQISGKRAHIVHESVYKEQLKLNYEFNLGNKWMSNVIETYYFISINLDKRKVDEIENSSCRCSPIFSCTPVKYSCHILWIMFMHCRNTAVCLPCTVTNHHE